tara:strand:- start:394 stop:1296 length:903 start_codon:yes stop_codon:yes gene_type:complete
MDHNALWLVMLLAANLGMSGCNRDLAEGVQQPETPTTAIDSIEAVISPNQVVQSDLGRLIGTWENKDEDGDGVLDEQDDYPFDASKSKYPLFIEQEPNDYPGIATRIEIDVGVRVQGVISSELDKGDLFKFVTTELKQYTAVFKTSSARFKPQVYVSNADGLVIDAIFLYKYTKPNVYVVNFPIYDAGTYQLSFIDENFAGGPDLSYEIVFFNDTDVDSFDDMKERALGSDLLENDMDQDKILDGLEFIFGMLNSTIDQNNDDQPNWLDSDSDGDSISDLIEGSGDTNQNGKVDFLDHQR